MTYTLAVAVIYVFLAGALAIGSGVFATKAVAEIQKVVMVNHDDPNEKENED